MALRAGRVGVNPTDVDEVTGHIIGGGSGGTDLGNETLIGTFNNENVYQRTVMLENVNIIAGFNDIPIGFTMDKCIEYNAIFSKNNVFAISQSHLNVGGLQVSLGSWLDDGSTLRVKAGSDLYGTYTIIATFKYTK